MRDIFFTWLGKTTYHKYWLVLIIGFLVTIVLGALASQIRMETSWMSMLPQEHESVKTFKRAIEQFGATTNIILALEGDNKERIIQAADELTPYLKEVIIEYEDDFGQFIKTNAVKRVEHKYDIDFFKNHGLMLEKESNLDKSKILYSDYNLVPFLTHLNDVYESQWVSDADNLAKQEKEAERGLDGIYQLLEVVGKFAMGLTEDSSDVQWGIDAATVGEGYFLSSDKNMLLIFITPTISIDEMMPTIITVDSIESRLDVFREKYQDINFALTGMQALSRDEMNAGMSDLMRNLSFAIILILAIFILSFRMWSGPLMAMMVLIIGIIWDIGIAQLIYGRLNIMTAMSSVILLGLGIDFAIHIISSYTELRHAGKSVEDSISLTYKKIGTGLLTGALTTAIAFSAIIVVGSSAFVEFGLVIGIGIICCLLVSIFLLPSVLVAKEKIWKLIRKDYRPKIVNMEFHFIGKLTGYSKKGAWFLIGACTIITVFLAIKIPDGEMNRNYMDLEPEGLESVRLQKKIVKQFHMSPDNMVAIFDNIDSVDAIHDRLNSRPSIGMVESIASVLPSRAKQNKRRAIVEEIRMSQRQIPKEIKINSKELIEQLYRFSDNITEISSMAYIGGQDRVFDKANRFIGLDEEGNQVGINRAVELAGYIRARPESIERLEKFQHYFRPLMQKQIMRMSNPEEITLSEIPESYRERYISKDSSHYLVAFYSNKDIWDGLYTSPFLKTMIRNVPNATGTPIFMVALVEKSKKEGVRAFAIAFAAIVLLLLIDFKSIKVALIALIPLLISITWLLGLMGLFDIKYTIVNIIGFPLLLGIGIDDGVHVIHRYKIEGKRKLTYAMSSIGKAILLTSLTTMLGFGSLMTAEYRAYIGLGLVVLIGIGLCFVSSVLILPAIMKLVWGNDKEHPEFFKTQS